MKKINQSDVLNETIILLENKQAEELFFLKHQFQLTYQSLKPLNILKSAFSEMTTSPDLKGNLISNAIGMSTGYLTKKVLLGLTHNPIKRILGTLLQFVITNVVTRHSDTLKS
jgi:hypothetical protein